MPTASVAARALARQSETPNKVIAAATSLPPADRAMLIALGAMLEDAEAITISRRRVAILVEGALFDAFNASVDVATHGGAL